MQMDGGDGCNNNVDVLVALHCTFKNGSDKFYVTCTSPKFKTFFSSSLRSHV